MKKALLVVSFGTTFHDTLEKNIAAIEGDLAAAFPDRDLYRAFTSGMILRRLRSGTASNRQHPGGPGAPGPGGL